jgi:hypothetical protein
VVGAQPARGVAVVDASVASPEDCKKAAAMRAAAALKYRPGAIRFLIVAETPPRELTRYFYFDTVTEHDHLFRNVLPHFVNEHPMKAGKSTQLAKLRELGVFLVDLKPDPCAPGEPAVYADDLVARVNALEPEHVILIKVNVWDAAATKLEAAGIDVIDARLPFPSSGQQGNFRTGFRTALKKAGWTSVAPE